MYENPFGLPEEEQTPSAPLTPIDYAALGAIGIGGGLLGRSLYKGANKIANKTGNVVEGLLHTKPGQVVTDALDVATDSTLGAMGRKMDSLDKNGAYARSGLGKIFGGKKADFSGYLPQANIKLPIMMGRSDIVDITPDTVHSAFKGLNQDLLSNKIAENLANVNRLTDNEKALLSAYHKKTKSLSAEDQQINNRFLHLLKAKQNVGDVDSTGFVTNPVDLFRNESEISTILGLLNTPRNKK
jgi:hypothetical protein